MNLFRHISKISEISIEKMYRVSCYIVPIVYFCSKKILLRK